MKITKRFLLSLLVLVALSFCFAACGDDEEAAAKCDEAAATKCTEDYSTCLNDALTAADPTAANDACISDWCSCVEDGGCDISKFDTTGICG